jgi:hypothetical protein
MRKLLSKNFNSSFFERKQDILVQLLARSEDVSFEEIVDTTDDSEVQICNEDKEVDDDVGRGENSVSNSANSSG